MQFDAKAFVRLNALQALDRSASGASYATSTGDIFEVACYGPGIFRLRAGPNTRPDYGLVVSRTKACTITPRSGATMLTAGDTSLEVFASPLRFRLLHRGAQVAESITDELIGGGTRLPAFGRRRQGGYWVAALALASQEPIYGLGEKFGPLDKRGQLIHSQVVDALGVNTGLSSKNAPFAWSPGMGKGAWGVFVNTPAMVTHSAGHPDWSHRSLALAVDDEALDLFLFAADTPAGILDLYTQLTGRPAPLPLWGLGLWVSRPSFRRSGEAVEFAADLRARKIPCDVLTLEASAAWKVETGVDFEWDSDRFSNPKSALAQIKSQHLKVCLWEWPYVSVHSHLFSELASRGYLLKRGDGEPCLVQWENTADGAPFGGEALPPCAIVDFTHPGAYVWWRNAHMSLFADGVDAIKSDFGEQIPSNAVAFNGDTGQRLHNVYSLLYNQCVFDATGRLQSTENSPGMVWSRAGWSGSQRYPIQSMGVAQSDWEGLAASIRGGLSWGMSGVPYHGSGIGGTYGPEVPTAELTIRWLQAAVFSAHMSVSAGAEREPWAFGSEAEAIARKWLAFRYRLIPYLQQAIAEAVATGMPVMRAMALAFPGNVLTRSYETQFMCGEALLVAPVLQEGGEVEIALPPGAWYDVNSRQRLPGQRVLRYKAALDQFPVFGREGYALPLGRAVQHTGEIDPQRPLEQLWVFGKPARSMEGLAQATIIKTGEGTFGIRATPDVKVELFGDASGIDVGMLDPSDA